MPVSEDRVSIDPWMMNQSAVGLLLTEAPALDAAGEIRNSTVGRATVWNFGVSSSEQNQDNGDQDSRNQVGSDRAGVLLARLSAADRLQVQLETDPSGVKVVVRSSCPVQACLGAQYAGWPVAIDDYFAMASGPGRIWRGKEGLWDHFELAQSPVGKTDADRPALLVLESDKLPDEKVIQLMVKEMGVAAENLHVCVAATHSLAGTLQIVARSLETALHQWETQKGPLGKIVSGRGEAPLPPTAEDSLQSIGLTNDAIIYGGTVTLVVEGDFPQLSQIGQRVPSENSESFGRGFMELFRAAGNDFYKMDARLFSPGRLQLEDCGSQQLACFGALRPDLFQQRKE